MKLSSLNLSEKCVGFSIILVSNVCTSYPTSKYLEASSVDVAIRMANLAPK